MSGQIRLADPNPEWPRRFEEEQIKIRQALGARVLRLEHVGSTSVADLPAKPVIDIILAVKDSADEPAYAPDLERAGYALRIREPEWYQHRMFRGANPAVNLHVFSEGCEEIERMIAFRDWLREHPADRERYAECKRALAERSWQSTDAYAQAKTGVVQDILARATGSRSRVQVDDFDSSRK